MRLNQVFGFAGVGRRWDRALTRLLISALTFSLIGFPVQAALSGTPQAPKPLPPLPAGVTDLKFGDFFVSPVGPRGLEFTEKLRKLDGQRVRILGYMVRQESAPPGMCLLAPIPIEMHEHDDHCFIDDLPATTMHVISPGHLDRRVPYAPGLVLLTGRLGVGNRLETDGRMSLVRLTLDPTEPDGRPPGAIAANPAWALAATFLVAASTAWFVVVRRNKRSNA